MKVIKAVCLLLLFLLCKTSFAADSPQAMNRPLVALQPLGAFDRQLAREVRDGILAIYDVDVEILPYRSLPEDAYHWETEHYRADKLVAILNAQIDPKYTKIVALTTWGISVPNGKIADYAISGYGLMSRRPCVASTALLHGNQVSHRVLLGRLVKIVNHELGHTFGLDHCKVPGCLMEDKAGTLRTVDLESGLFCEKCRRLLGNVLRPEAKPLMLASRGATYRPVAKSSVRAKNKN